MWGPKPRVWVPTTGPRPSHVRRQWCADEAACVRINPIRNSYDMYGYLLSQFRVELLDQHGDPVDTMGEEYNTTLVIEYEV